MNTITKMVVVGLLYLVTTEINAQNKENDTIYNGFNNEKIETLINLKERIKEEEKEFLKVEVEAIEFRLENGSITVSEADALKRAAAQKRALNIENRLAIVENRIEFLKRNEDSYKIDSEELSKIGISIGGSDDTFTGISLVNKNKPRKYDLRTTSDLVFAIGFNNAVIDGEDFSDSPYEVIGSGFTELGWAWKTRVFDNSNALRFIYGFSIQWNKLSAKDNLYFEQDANTTELVEFPVDLNKSKFRMTNLVLPLHFELGSSKKIEKDTYFRYSTDNHFKIGFGVYAGLNISTQQKLKFKEDGDRVKQKIRKDYNTSDFVYGLSGYVGIGDLSLYAKYDLSPIFKDQTVEQNNISLGIRFDLD